MSEPTQKPLTAEKIEALLRAARDRLPAVRSDVLSSEPLGPGDVQHLRNITFSETAFAESGWPGNMLPADELLRQAEQQLADAMSTQGDFFDTTPAVTKPFPLAPFDPAPATGSASGLSMESLNDIELDVTLELGRAEVTIEELLQLREGSVVPLDKAAGDPIDILANGRLVARGEVIVVDDKFGVRICEVISQR
ncbi:MAG: flagellar motor switch protein FliN [Candidatus Saccharimonas sp.]|nr:flagellar motor switch protein FliN [Planctomycetaceae bacterium]